jgi:uncharacterized membrane protein YkoI
LVAGLCFGLLCAVYAWADEDEQESEIALDKAPKAVQETILKEAGKNKIEGIVEITAGDKKFYKVEWKENDKDVEMLLGEDGKIIKKEKEVTIDSVPAPVKETFTKKAGKNEFKEILEITENGKTIYEAEWGEKGKATEIIVTPEGKIVSVTKDVTIDDVPKAVKETMLKEAGANKIEDIEVITEGDKTTYEAEWIDNGKEVDLKVSPDGKIISKESGEVKKEEKGECEEKGKKEKDEENEKDEDND